MLLGQSRPKQKWVQIVLGRWIFILQFRRPGMAALTKSWNYISEDGGQDKWWPVVQQELASLMCLLPVLQSDLRSPFSSVVTCSDASHYGGAVAVATDLTEAGAAMTDLLRNDTLQPKAIKLLVISAFNGIGGAFRCYDVNGIRPAGLISIEWDKSAQRVTRKAWPHSIEIGDVNSVTRQTVWEWSNMFPRVTHVHVIGGFPCVHLSSARADRQNLEGEGSCLFWNFKDIITWCKEAFRGVAQVDYLIENVFSMDVEARSEISRELGVEPLVLCPSDILPYNRPRLAWCTIPVVAGEGVTLCQHDGYVRVHMSGSPLEDHQWLEPGWRRCNGEQPLATFMKAIVC